MSICTWVQLPMQSRRGHWITWKWICRWLWIPKGSWEPNLSHLQELHMLSTTESALQTLTRASWCTVAWQRGKMCKHAIVTPLSLICELKFWERGWTYKGRLTDQNFNDWDAEGLDPLASYAGISLTLLNAYLLSTFICDLLWLLGNFFGMYKWPLSFHTCRS